MHVFTVLNVALAAVVAVTLAGCGGGGSKKATSIPSSVPATIRLSSPAFAPNGTIPKRFTCDGAGDSPPLAWSGVPAGARSLSLDVSDPDAPSGTFVHWVVTGIAARVRGVAANAVPAGASEQRRWTPPCPPPGDSPHRYVFRLVARSAAGGFVAQGRLVGRYSR